MRSLIGPGFTIRGARTDQGQSTVEFALVLPIALLVVLAGVDVAVIARDAARVQHAARLAARVAAVEGDAGLARAVANAQVSEAEVGITLAPVGQQVVATVRLPLAHRLGVLGRLRRDLDVTAQVAMRREGDPDG